MIIKEIKKNKKDYIIVIDEQEIIADENTIVKLNLYVNKEIDENTIEMLYKSYYYEKYYNLALNYSIKYNKSKKGVFYYLKEKEVEAKIAYQICDELEEKKIINDLLLAKNYIITLINKSYGEYYIINKLKEMYISNDIIDIVINDYNYNDYIESMNRYISKNISKYNKLSDNIRKYKIYEDLKRRGYKSDDISMLSITIKN